ncbi:MAG: hypothetical protein WC792_06545 [Candidatus Micrarchaeia archaeon]|jgi:hypothetical protein
MAKPAQMTDAKPAQAPASAGASAEGEDAEDEESDHLPFPNARVVRKIKENLTREHQVKKEVKESANILLGDILADISRTMDAEDYYTLSVEHFNKAARKYREIEYNQKRIFRVKKVLEKQRAELDEIIAEIEVDYPEMRQNMPPVSAPSEGKA